MSAPTTPRNGIPKVQVQGEPSRNPTPLAYQPPVDRDEPGRKGLNIEPSPQKSSVTVGDRWKGLTDRVVAWVLDHIHTPKAFALRPGSWAEVSDYARCNARIISGPEWIQAASNLWCYLIVAPTYWASGIRLYVRARFWRSVIVYGAGSLFIWQTPIGRWFGHHVAVIGVFLLTHLLP
jgi:hypothetical protein